MATSAIYLLFLGIFHSVLPQCYAREELVSCKLGDICVLPCQHQGQLDMVHWTRLPQGYNVHVYIDGKDELSNQLPLYTNRTSLPGDLSRGNASLLISEVTLKDQGRFRCFTSSNRGRQSHSLKLTVFAPVLQVSMEQEGQQLLCRSEGIYPRPTVVWTPSAEPKTTVTESEQGLFSVLSSVTLSHSEDKYICNISTEHSWRRAVLRVKELTHVLDEWSSYQEGLYSCLQQTDTESVILRLQVKRPNFAFLITFNIVWILLWVIIIFMIFHIRSMNKKNMSNLKQQLKEKEHLLNEISRKYEQLEKSIKTKRSKSQTSQDQPPDEQDRSEGSAPGDPHESSAVVRVSPVSDQVHEEMHHSSLGKNEDKEPNGAQQKSELEGLMSNHGESSGVKIMEEE